VKTILVIEESHDLRENTVELLELEGYKVLSASNGFEGFGKAIQNVPDVILYDMLKSNPRNDHFLKRLREEKVTRDILLISFSEDPVPFKPIRYGKYGTNGSISKPFTYEQLLQIVHLSLNPVNKAS
jgi:CheY-like chemotaxis protein